MVRLLSRIKLRSERGMALPLALLVLATTGALTVTVFQYSSSSGNTAQVAKSRASAQSLAEAAIANALSVLNNAVDPKTPGTLPAQGAAVPVTMEGGTATYWGVYDSVNYKWTITGFGSIPNPTGGAALTRTITRAAQIHGLNSGASVGAWNRMYHDSTTTCLTIEDMTITTPIASRGDMCLVGSGKVTGAATTIEVGDDVTMTRNTLQVNRPAGAGAGTSWSGAGNIVSSNNVDATYSVGGNGQSSNLDATGFGFAIPTTATIVGVYAEIERAASSSGYLHDYDVFLLKAGATAGTDHASNSYYSTSDQTKGYGNQSDLWGTTWTPAQINATNFGLRLKVDNDNGSARTASVDSMEITVYYKPVPTTSIGVSGTNILQAHVAGTCSFDGGATGCTPTNKVYAGTIDTVPSGLSKPSIDMGFWYANAKPGPKQACTTSTGTPPVWDNDSSFNQSLPVNDNWSEVTPTARSYTCQVRDAQNNLLGELSWNYATHVLTIFGTIFLDGDFRFDDDGQVVHYVGRGIIYASRDIEYDELVCAGGTGATGCSADMSNWDPSANMMTVLAGRDAEFDQGSTQALSTPSGLQGLIYAVGNCWVHQNFLLSGPIICNKIDLHRDDTADYYPTIYPWPPLGSLVEGQAYSSAVGAADYLVTAGDQLG